MSKNKLFNFILNHLYLPDDQPITQAKLYLKKDKRGTDYFQLELPHLLSVSLAAEGKSYQLTGHHVSVYESQDKNSPVLSQYHYTAYFDCQGQTYRLHVYFDEKNDLTCPPIFAMEEEGTYRTKMLPTLDDSFKHLAIRQASLVINELRSLYDIYKIKLVNEHKKVEQETSKLSEDYLNHLEAYQAHLLNMGTLLDHLYDLTFDVHYKHQNKIVFSLLNALGKNQINSSIIEEIEEIEEVDNEPEDVEVSVELVKNDRIKEQAENNLKSYLETINKDYDDLQNLLKTENHEEQVAQVNKIYYFIKNHLTCLDEEVIVAKPRQLTRLHQLTGSLNRIGENLLQVLVLKNKFELARQLEPFYYSLNANLLGMALTTANAKLVEFLAKSGQFSLNTQPISIRNKTYPTAIHYCADLQNNSKKLLDDCLNALVANGASLLVVDERGLPLAHTFLSNQQHPLHHAVGRILVGLENIQKFYAELIAALKVYQQNSNLDEAEKTNLTKSLEYYQRCLKGTINNNQFFGNSLGSVQQIQRNIKEKIGTHEFVMRLKEDSDIINLNKRILSITDEYIKVLPKQQRRQEAILRKNALKTYDKIFDPKLLDLFESYEDCKCEVTMRLEEAILIINQRIELINIQSQLRRLKTSMKERKKLAVREKQLIDSINNYEEGKQNLDVAKINNALADLSKTKQLFKSFFSAEVDDLEDDCTSDCALS